MEASIPETDAVESLRHCEAVRMAFDSANAVILCAVMVIPTAGLLVAAIAPGLWGEAEGSGYWAKACLLGAAIIVGASCTGIWLTVRKPWRSRRRQQDECLEILRTIGDSLDQGDAGATRVQATLKMLSGPLSGQPRANREFAAQLHARVTQLDMRTLPIAAEHSGSDVRDLPLPTVSRQSPDPSTLPNHGRE